MRKKKLFLIILDVVLAVLICLIRSKKRKEKAGDSPGGRKRFWPRPDGSADDRIAAKAMSGTGPQRRGRLKHRAAGQTGENK